MRVVQIDDYLSSLHEGYWYNWKSLQDGKVYENIIVIDNTKTLPSKEECEQGIKDLQAEWDAKDIDQQRQSAYQYESDPLFFKWQAGEVTEQEWKDKRVEIKERYPKE